MGEHGKALVLKEFNKRLIESDVDRVVIAMSRNGCEIFFRMLSKFSHRKRTNYGRIDS